MEQTLGKRIAAFRKKNGMTQEGLAEKLGITAQAVSKWENDQSCPDITMLPRLAEIFHVSTDELLGIGREKAQEAEIVPPEPEKESGVNLEINLENSKKNSVAVAVLVLLVGGVLLLGSILQWDLTFWSVFWPSALLIFGLSGIRPGFSFLRVGCALVGGYYLLCLLKVIPDSFQLSKNMIFPLLLVFVGLNLLGKALRKPERPWIRIGKNGKTVASVNKNHFTKGGESFSCAASFGEKHYEVQLPRLSSGEAAVSFGELAVDLTGCTQIVDGCRLNVSCSFGELILCVPKNCRIEPAITTAFAEYNVSGHPDADAPVTIRVEGSVNFGEIVVKYV